MHIWSRAFGPVSFNGSPVPMSQVILGTKMGATRGSFEHCSTAPNQNATVEAATNKAFHVSNHT